MQPVVVNPAISFTQLAHELVQVTSDEERALVRDQFVAKLQRKKRHLSEAAARDFETCAGMPPDAFIERLQSMPLADIAAWFTQNPDLGEILDRQGEGRAEPVFVSDHDDRLLGTERGYGQAKRPEDYLQEFSDFIQLPQQRHSRPHHRAHAPARAHPQATARAGAGARQGGLQRGEPRHCLARDDQPGHRRAYRRLHPPGRHRRSARALRPARGQRPAEAARLAPLDHAAAPVAAEDRRPDQGQHVVDREALDDPDLVFKREGGGFGRLDSIFGGELQQVLDTFNESLWPPAA